MLDNSIETFNNSLYLFIIKKVKSFKGSNLLKRHTENLATHGDFSFPNTLKSWRNSLDFECVLDANCKTVLASLGISLEDIVQESNSWNLKINKINEDVDRVYVYLERLHAIRVGLQEGLRNNFLLSRKLKEEPHRVITDPQSENCLTSLRVQYMCMVIKNLSLIKNCKPKIFVTSKSSSKSADHLSVLCGTVLNAKSGIKETEISADEYIRIRQNEMTLIAQHKYGVRVSTDSKWKEFISHLGESAVAFELLQTRPSSAVKINFDTTTRGSSKGASFVLYNCARLETIIRTFNERVNEGVYPKLPNYDETDFSLLIDEDEWSLIFNYIMGLPSLLSSCAEINEDSCEFRPHYICNYLCSMVKLVSQYYRRIRILTEARKHLLPVLFARIHMLQILNDTLKLCLSIINIKSVSQMYICWFYCSRVPTSVFVHNHIKFTTNTRD